jgi:hypothetical protein
MIKNVVENLARVDIYGIISMVLFFSFFTGMLVWAFRLKKSYLDAMGGLPLDGGEIAPDKSLPTGNQKDPSDE